MASEKNQTLSIMDAQHQPMKIIPVLPPDFKPSRSRTESIVYFTEYTNFIEELNAVSF